MALDYGATPTEGHYQAVLCGQPFYGEIKVEVGLQTTTGPLACKIMLPQQSTEVRYTCSGFAMNQVESTPL